MKWAAVAVVLIVVTLSIARFLRGRGEMSIVDPDIQKGIAALERVANGG